MGMVLLAGQVEELGEKTLLGQLLVVLEIHHQPLLHKVMLEVMVVMLAAQSIFLAAVVVLVVVALMAYLGSLEMVALELHQQLPEQA
jgi:hypothetical protein